jgi:ribosomal protein S18 acetylase RimI-like enzyme
MTVGWFVRPARTDDLEAMVRLQLATWRHDYQEWLGTDFCDERFEKHVRARLTGFLENDAPFRRTLVLEHDKHWAGFVAYGAADRHPGEVFSMYIEPSLRGRGGGEYLFRRAWSALAARGATPVQVAVLERNTQAQHFYRRLGASEFMRAEFELNGCTLQEVVFVVRSLASSSSQ